MSMKLSVPITIRIPGGTWAGFVRRIDSQLDLLVESSGSFRVGDSGSFEMELKDVPGRIEGMIRVTKAGDRSGPFTRYILRISKVTSRNARSFHAWLREHPRAGSGRALQESSPDSHGAGDTIPPNFVATSGPRVFPKRPVDVDVPITMRLDTGLAAGTMRRFQGQRFAVEAEDVIRKGAEVYFQFALPTYNTVVYGTATVEQEVAQYGRSHFYVMHLQKMRDADRDLLLGWLHEIAPDDAFVDSEVVTRPAVTGSAVPNEAEPADALSDRLTPRSETNPGRKTPEVSDISASEGRRGLRDVLRGFFFRSPSSTDAKEAAPDASRQASSPSSADYHELPEEEGEYDEEYDEEEGEFDEEFEEEEGEFDEEFEEEEEEFDEKDPEKHTDSNVRKPRR